MGLFSENSGRIFSRKLNNMKLYSIVLTTYVYRSFPNIRLWGRFAQERSIYWALRARVDSSWGLRARMVKLRRFAQEWSRHFGKLRARMVGKITHWKRNGHPRRSRRRCPFLLQWVIFPTILARSANFVETVLARSALYYLTILARSAPMGLFSENSGTWFCKQELRKNWTVKFNATYL